MKCRLCKSNRLSFFLDLGRQPLANKYPKNSDEIKKEKLFKLELLFCNSCKSLQIKKIISRKHMFEDYYYLSSVNKGLVDHFKNLSKKFNKKSFVLDIGSNDGILLNELKNRNIKFLGVDPSVNVGKIANSKGLTTLIDFFNNKTVRVIKKNYGNPDYIVASSVFTHMSDPNKFIESIKKLLANNGTFILEIEYLPSILKNFQFERFYFDRPFYYSLNTIINIFKKKKMYVEDAEKIKPHGGSIRIYIKNKKIKYSKRLIELLNEEKKILKVSNLNLFSKKIQNLAIDFNSNLKKHYSNGDFIIGYGSPARLATITNFAKIEKKLIKFIVEDSPLKIGRYTPGIHIPIKKRSAIDIKKKYKIILFAYDYFKDIRKKLKGYRCDYFLPIPFKKIK